ncbi:MAG: D-glycerate dehydrogenase [Candidatus Thorarchaeota archaeon]|nr:MAG: D-glycerate dehydrogenase [Candidatus Thorarchaeota archaeon]
MAMRVFVTRRIPDKGLEIIRSEFETSVWEPETPPSAKEIAENARDCVGLVSLLSDPINGDVIKALPELRVIAQYAVGYDNIDVRAATKRGIIVTNTPGVLTETTADLAWALIMAASRRVAEADRYVRSGQWRVAWIPQLLLGIDIYGATLGIVGMGRIGAAVARRAKGFSMKILYADVSETDAAKGIEKETGATRTDLPSLLNRSDIVTIHVPLTDQTRKMIGRNELAMMKENAVLVNTSRGPIIDEAALAEALSSKRLHAAGLDVFTDEPLPMSSMLMRLPNVVLAPHIGSASFATRSKMAVMCADNLIAALRGARPPNIVNPEVMSRLRLETPQK